MLLCDAQGYTLAFNIIPLSIIMFRITEVRYKRLHDCTVVEKNV
jgi:hypothetical protein